MKLTYSGAHPSIAEGRAPFCMRLVCMRLAFVSASIVACLLAAAAASGATDGAEADRAVEKISGEGSAPGASPEARQQAIVQAQRDAMLQALESLAGPDRLGACSEIFHQPTPFFRSFDVTDYTVEDGLTRVMIEAWVRMDTLRQAVANALVQASGASPRAVLAIAEQADGDGLNMAPDGTLSKALFELLGDAGLNLLDPATLAARYSQDHLLAVVRGAVPQAAEFARHNQADVAIVGEARIQSERIQETANVFENRAEIKVRVTGAGKRPQARELQAVAEVQSLDPANGGRQALEDAAMKLAQDVFVAAVIAWANVEGTQDERGFLLSIEGLESEQQFEALAESIEAKPGVIGVERLSYASGSGRLMVDYSGNPASFVERVVRAPHGPVQLQPKVIVDRELELQAQPAASNRQ